MPNIFCHFFVCLSMFVFIFLSFFLFVPSPSNCILPVFSAFRYFSLHLSCNCIMIIKYLYYITSIICAALCFCYVLYSLYRILHTLTLHSLYSILHTHYLLSILSIISVPALSMRNASSRAQTNAWRPCTWSYLLSCPPRQFAVVVMGREVDWCSCGRHRCVYGRHGNGGSGILKVWRGAVRLRGRGWRGREGECLSERFG